MKKIKTYEDFVNEEINLRKGLMGAALGASLALSNPSFSQNTVKDSTLQSRVDDVKYKMDKIGSISNIDCWYKNIDGKWSNLKNNGLKQIEKTGTRLENITSYTFKNDSSEYIIFLINSNSEETGNPKIGDNGNILIFKIDDIINIDKVSYNESNTIKALYTPLLTDVNFESSIILSLSHNYEWNKKFKKDNKEGGIIYKLGYDNGDKKIRFKFDISDDPYAEVENLKIENFYYEMNLDVFKSLIKKVEVDTNIKEGKIQKGYTKDMVLSSLGSDYIPLGDDDFWAFNYYINSSGDLPKVIKTKGTFIIRFEDDLVVSCSDIEFNEIDIDTIGKDPYIIKSNKDLSLDSNVIKTLQEVKTKNPLN
jgi:hypothetical protein